MAGDQQVREQIGSPGIVSLATITVSAGAAIVMSADSVSVRRQQLGIQYRSAPSVMQENHLADLHRHPRVRAKRSSTALREPCQPGELL